MIPFNTDAAELASILFDAAAKGVLLLTLGLLAVLFMKRNSAAARHLALCLAFAGLLLFPVLSWTLPQLDVLPHWMSIRPFHSTRTWQPVTNWFPPAASEHIHTKTTPSSIPSEPRLTAQGPSTGSMPIPTSANAPWSFSKWLLSIWLFGAFCVFAPTAAGLVSLWFLRRRSQVIRSGPLFALVDQLKRDISYRGRLSLLTSKIRRMPMIWGVFRPAILLPEDAVDWPEERKRVVLLHELAHIQRHDFLTTLAARLACALHWFNPLVWIAARQIRREQEQACDDVVLRMGSSAEDYAEEVLEFAAAGSAASVESLSAVAMARASSLEGRLLAILDDTRNRTSPTRTGTFAAVIASIIAMIPLSMLSAAETTRSFTRSHLERTSMDRGLVAWWRGDDDANDSAGNHDGTIPFGVRFFSGLTGKAFNFMRSHAIEDQLQRVSIADSPDFALTETVTIEAWIYPIQYDGIVLFRGDDRAGYDTWQIDLRTEGHISYVFNTADNQGFGINAPIQLYQWQHIAAVFDRGSAKLYINGILANHKQTDLRPIAALDAASNPALGIGNTGGKHYNMPFDGLIDEVRIYNRALSEAEIYERMKQ